MLLSRRVCFLLPGLSLTLTGRSSLQETQIPGGRQRHPEDEDESKLPNGKSQKDAIAKSEHEKALKDADELISLANELKGELEKAGNYVVPVSSVKKTEEIEKVARRIRGRLRS